MANEERIRREIDPEELRDPNANTRYRNLSQSRNMASQHAAHKVSLKIAAEALNEYRPQGRQLYTQDEVKEVKKFVNILCNFRMINRDTNLQDHNIIDNTLIDERRKSATVRLNGNEAARVKQQIKFLKSHHNCYITGGMYSCFRKFYEAFMEDDACIWETVNPMTSHRPKCPKA